MPLTVVPNASQATSIVIDDEESVQVVKTSRLPYPLGCTCSIRRSQEQTSWLPSEKGWPREQH